MNDMTYASFNISIPIKDIPMFRKLSSKMGWPVNEILEPNEETIAAMREAESGENLEVLDVDHFMEYVASL
jgi:hypothetical protein